MAKQSKDIYVSLINRIAFVMLLNQGLLLLLSRFLNVIKNIPDVAYLLLECVVYFLSFVLPVVLFYKMNKYSQKEIYEPKESDKKSPLYTIILFGMGLVFIYGSSFVNYFLVNLFTDYSKFSSEMLWYVELKHPYQIIIYFISYAIIPALVEELLFRGTVCRSLAIYGKGTAVVVSAVLFALMHTNIEQILYTFVAGLFVGWLYVETKSILAPILLHFVNNSISVIGEILYQNSSPLIYETYISLTDTITLLIGLLSCVGFLAFIKKHKITLGKKIEMKSDENGNEVLSLSVSERISGFFSFGMVIFVIYCVAIMSYYVYLSVIL
ncbi:MAG: CPBP family intramembrane metalloprotease [Clostridia bacterium]|nr:CPBP family intramembrane metalloprotease [Clostridia bacterium]